MKTIQFPPKRLLAILNRKKIASMDELKNELGTKTPITVFRKLKELDYISSISHSGKYYTLKHIAKFNEIGLWIHKSVIFSTYDTLFETLRNLIEKSDIGYTAIELEELIKIKPNAVLLELIKKKKVYREKILGKYVYFSKDKVFKTKQILNRKGSIHKYDSEVLNSRFYMDEVKAALILFFSILDEKQRRLFAGLESLKMGYGGDIWIAEVLGIDKKTVAKGKQELLDGKINIETIRSPGGGRKQVKKKFQE